MEYKLDVHNSEWCDDGAEFCIVEITAKGVQEIVKLAKIAQEHDLNNVSKFDYSPEFYVTDYEAEEERPKEFDGRTECDQLIVGRDAVYWEGYYKHTGLLWSTDSVSIIRLQEMEKVASAEVEELPTFIDTLKTEQAQYLLKERLAGKGKD